MSNASTTGLTLGDALFVSNQPKGLNTDDVSAALGLWRRPDKATPAAASPASFALIYVAILLIYSSPGSCCMSPERWWWRTKETVQEPAGNQQARRDLWAPVLQGNPDQADIERSVGSCMTAIAERGNCMVRDAYAACTLPSSVCAYTHSPISFNKSIMVKITVKTLQQKVFQVRYSSILYAVLHTLTCSRHTARCGGLGYSG